MPAITSLKSHHCHRWQPGRELTVNGTNFVSGVVVRWKGVNRTTTFVSATQPCAQPSRLLT